MQFCMTWWQSRISNCISNIKTANSMKNSGWQIISAWLRRPYWLYWRRLFLRYVTDMNVHIPCEYKRIFSNFKVGFVNFNITSFVYCFYSVGVVPSLKRWVSKTKYCRWKIHEENQKVQKWHRESNETYVYINVKRSQWSMDVDAHMYLMSQVRYRKSCRILCEHEHVHG